MFTGIVEEVGRVAEIEELEGGRRIRVACSFAAELRPDESVATNGVCLTVTERAGAADAPDGFWCTAVEETLAKTSLGALGPGDGVNLERALKLGARLDGHLVQGHVDATAEVVSVEALDDSHLVRLRYRTQDAAYLIPRGSLCVDGISLTVARLDDEPDTLALAIIPHTWGKTTAASWRPGDAVNLEYDLVGKYVLRRAERAG